MEDAREVNEGRVKLMEQIEKNHDQLSRSHAKLKQETKSIQEHNEVLSESLQSLVEKCEQYKVEMEILKRENTKLQKQLSSTQDPAETAVEKVEQKELQNNENLENNCQDLSDVIQDLKIKQDLEKSMREDLENELSQLIVENQDLEQKLRLFAMGNGSSYEDEQKDEWHGGKEDSEIEIELDENSLNDSFVMVEEQTISEFDSEPSLEQSEISFLDELDQQYRDLVGKYNALVEKCKSEGVPYASREMSTVQRGVQTSQEEIVTSVENLSCGKEMGCETEVGGGVEVGNGAVPKYKRMFANLYEKIREGKSES